MIEIYGTADCGYCKKAIQLCVDSGLDYNYIDIDYVSDYDQLISKLGNFRTVPQIVLDNVLVGGYDDLVEAIRENKIGL